MIWLEGAISRLQQLSQMLDRLEHLAIISFMAGVRVILIGALLVWAGLKCWALAKTLLGV